MNLSQSCLILATEKVGGHQKSLIYSPARSPDFVSRLELWSRHQEIFLHQSELWSSGHGIFVIVIGLVGAACASPHFHDISPTRFVSQQGNH